MKKIISVYIIFAFLLTSFAGCGKLKSSPVSGLNQSKAPAPPEVNSQSEASNSSEVVNHPEASNPPEVDAKDLTKKESWKEWTCRQWKDNKWYWIGGVIVVVGIGDVYYYRRSTERISIATQCCLRTNRHLPVSGSQLRNQIQVARIGFYEAEIDRLDAEILRLTAEIQKANT